VRQRSGPAARADDAPARAVVHDLQLDAVDGPQIDRVEHLARPPVGDDAPCVDHDQPVRVRRSEVEHPGFVGPLVEGTTEALREIAAEGIPTEDVRILFVTHSIPTAMAAASGPPGRFDENGAYVAQHLATAQLVVDGVVAEGLTAPEWSLVYQSRSGAPHIPWLEPDINDALRDLAADGMKAAVVVPIGFVSDHVEVIWDLDNEAKETCDELGVRMARVATPGTHASFVSAIADLVEARIAGGPGEALSELGPWSAVCAVNCCANARADLPTVCGEDSTHGVLAS